VNKNIDLFDKLKKRIPEGFTLINESGHSLTEDEYVVAATWMKALTRHVEAHGKKEMLIKFVPISKRMYLDLGLYYMKDYDDNLICICKTSRATISHNERTLLL